MSLPLAARSAQQQGSPARRPFRALLGTYLGPQRGQMLLLGLLLFAGIALQLAGPQVLGNFIDSATGEAPLDTLTWLAALYLGLAVAGQVAGVAETYLAQNIGLTATNWLRN